MFMLAFTFIYIYSLKTRFSFIFGALALVNTVYCIIYKQHREHY